jgi:hypothetical protein
MVVISSKDVDSLYRQITADLADGIIVHAAWFNEDNDITFWFRVVRVAVRQGGETSDLIGWNNEGKEQTLNSADMILRHTKKKSLLDDNVADLGITAFLELASHYR